MCKYCDNLDVTGRGQNIAIRRNLRELRNMKEKTK